MFGLNPSPITNEKNRILLLFSDVNASPMLLEIVKNLHRSQSPFRVAVIGSAELEICKAMRNLGIPFSLVSKRSKYGFARMLFSVSREILTFRPETILASGQFATILGMVSAYATRVPRRLFIRHHSNFHTRYGMHLGMWIDRAANSMSTGIVAVSEVVKNILINTEGVNSAKVTLIHNGIDLQRFTGSNLRKKNAHSGFSEDIHVGIVSRFTEWKGVQYSVDAFIQLISKFPNSHLHIIGAPADSFALITEKLKVLDESAYTLSDWHPDILGFLRTLDIFVHVPIGPEDEAFGLVYLEALASKTPCIFTLSGVLHELPSPEKYAEIVPFENSSAIHSSMINILSGNSPKKESMPEKWLEQYSLDTMAGEYMKLLLGVN